MLTPPLKADVIRFSVCVLAALVLGSAFAAQTLTWTGGGVAGKWDDSANWGNEGVPMAGDTAVFNASVDITSDFSVDAGDKIVIQANAGATVNFTGEISGSAPIELDGAGTIGFGGANTFTGALEIKVVTFNANSDGAFGSADAGTTFRSVSGSKWYFNGITTDEPIAVYNPVGEVTLQFPENTINVFNGAWSRKNEQYRMKLLKNAQVRFNADFADDINCMTPTLDDGAVLDFNAAMYGSYGVPRLGGTGTVIYRKPLTGLVNAHYGFAYQFKGTIKLLCENVFGTGASAFGISSTYNNADYTGVMDLSGFDQQCAYLCTRSLVLTSTGGAATLHVLNDSTRNAHNNNDVYGGKVTGPVSISVEGNSQLEALTLSAVSESEGTLIVKDGGKAVFTGSGKWGTGGAVIGSGSSIVLANSETFGVKSSIEIAEGGTIVIPSGVVQTVKALALGSVIGENGKTYGSLETTANVDVRSACISGDGVIKVVSGQALTWKGPSGGSWSSPANWEPNDVPAFGDTLTFDASIASVNAVNDLSGLTLKGINFTGANAIELSGNGVTMGNNGTLWADGCSGGIAFGLPLQTSGADGTVITSTAVGGAVSTWTFTGAWSGSSRVTFDGDHTGVYNFRQKSPAFDGELWLSNAGEYHLYEAQALGSTTGYTRYEVRQGSYTPNGGKTLEPLWFHGIETSENFLIAGLSTFSFYFAAGTTNVLQGALDAPVDRFETKYSDTERFQLGANAKLTVSGPVSCKTLPNSERFEIILFYGDAGSTVELNSEWGGSGIRACPALGGECVFNVPQTKAGYVGIFNAGTLRIGCDNLLGTDGKTQFTCGYSSACTVDLDGHALVAEKVVDYNSSNPYRKLTTFKSSTSGGELDLKVSSFVSPIVGPLAVKVLSDCDFAPVSVGSDVTLSIENGATATLGDGVVMPADVALAIAEGSVLNLPASADQPLGSLTLGSTVQLGGYSYGSAESSADRKSAFFAGKGVVRIAGSIDADVRMWVGPNGGKWSENENWDPAGPIGYGNVLVFDSTEGAVTSENDIDLIKVTGIRLLGDNPITLGGKVCNVLSGGEGIRGVEGSLAQVNLALPFTFDRETADPVMLNAASGQVFCVTGSIGGGANIVLGGGGAVELRADSTFTGVLTMTNGVLDVYADGAFGTTDGKTAIRIPSTVPAGCRPPKVTFHGVTVAENLEWYQTDYGDNALIFPAGTTNTFNGTFTGTGGQPRVSMANDASVVFNGTMSGVAAYTVNTTASSTYDLNGDYSGNNFRFQGKGELRVAGKMTLYGFDYMLLHNDASPRLRFMAADRLAYRGQESEVPTLALASGVADLNGFSQRALSLCGSNLATVTNSGDLAELALTMEWNWPCTMDGAGTVGKVMNNRFDGSIRGPVNLTIEGSAMPTQFLGGVSTSTGALTVKNGGTVCLDKNGRWGGEVNVQADSKLVFADHAAFCKRTTLRLSGNGQVVLNSDANIRCRELYIDGVAAAPGRYSAATDGTHFAGEGSLTVTGTGMLLLVR